MNNHFESLLNPNFACENLDQVKLNYKSLNILHSSNNDIFIFYYYCKIERARLVKATPLKIARRGLSITITHTALGAFPKEYFTL